MQHWPITIRLTRWTRFLVLTSLLLSTQALALEAINTTFFGNLAIKGYDSVAYFTRQKAVKGSGDHEFIWMNATWHFSSAKNLALFQANPESYAPQYGGYCAYAVAKNDTASIEPDQFTIHEGKLYLNYNGKINKKWRANMGTYILDADENWPKLLSK